MIRDFRSFDGQPDPIECDLCIVGAGAAGITLALQFVGTPLEVLVLESGGFEYEPEIQDLYVGQNVGRPYYDLDVARLRYLGGTTNHWMGWSLPLTELDLARKPWVPYSGWPIARSELDPFYAAAHAVLEIGAPDLAAGALGLEMLALSPEHLDHRLYRRSPPTRFGERYRSDLQRAGNVEVWLHANATEVVADDAAARAIAMQVATLDGKQARVHAAVFVLALGGIETPRLLLNSTGVAAAGLGNQRDLVGRFFMEHLEVFTGQIVAATDGWTGAYRPIEHDPTRGTVWPAIGLSALAQEREAVLNFTCSVTETFIARLRSEGYSSLTQLKKDVLALRLPSELGGHLWNIVTDLAGVVRGLHEGALPTFGIFSRSEQAPDPESRVRLSAERDALGSRRVALDWRLSDLDRRTSRVATGLIARELGRLGVARVQIDAWLAAEDGSWTPDLLGGNHHIGTLRMAEDPAHGVVDRDARVFGLDNLYIAGSAVFPTGGASPPTLTIVALTLRLAEHLARRFAIRPLPLPGTED
jgi:choline dehydrogenase-like flavoprotein